MSTLRSLFRGYEEDRKRAWAAYAKDHLDDALTILAPYRGLLAIDLDLTMLYARLLQRTGEFGEAEALLDRLLISHAEQAQAIVLRAQCLVALDRRADALAFLDESRAAAPNDNVVLGAYLALLLSESGLAAAIAALRSEHRRRTPPHRLGEAIEKLRQKALSLYDDAELRRHDPDDLLELDTAARGSGYSLRAIYETFESVGSNCELGHVQRQNGAEPLSLFRWTFVNPANLSRLLACDLEGYDKPEIFSLHREKTDEFLLIENVFQTRSHTGVYRGDVPENEFLERLVRRQGFLKRKFLADAAQGRKIFTYKADKPLGEDEIAEIEGHFLRMGVRHTLFMMPTDVPGQAGTVKFDSSSRAVGYLSSVMPTIQFEEWNKIAIAVHDQFLRA